MADHLYWRGVAFPSARAHIKLLSPAGFPYHNGRLLQRVRVKPIFWGPQWLPSTHPPVQMAEVFWAIRTIMFSPYMDGLAQYGGIQRGTIEPPGLATFDAGPSNVFTTADIEAMLRGLLDDRIIPSPAMDNQVLAAVFTPPGVRSDLPDATGFHSSMRYQNEDELLPFAWIGSNGTIEYISITFSHELAEASTNPTNRGFFDESEACGELVCEIADYCEGGGPIIGSQEAHGGVYVQPYWSLTHNRCFVPQERVVRGATLGSPSLIQGPFLSPGNFELVAPLQSGGIAHYSRVNVDPALPWSGAAVFATEVGHVESVSMIQSSFTAGAHIGNLEVVALSQGALFAFWREDVPPFRWHGPTAIPLGGVSVRGNPALIQGRFLSPGNFELVVPLSTAGIAHYSRVNVDQGVPWHGPEIFGVELGQVDAVTLIQSNYTAGANIGNLEVIARCGGTLFSFFREDVSPFRWSRPTKIPASGANPGFPLAAGCPSLVQNRSFARNFELVTPLADGGLAHYTRNNAVPGTPWLGPAIFGTSLKPIDSVSLIQSTFTLDSHGVGNLELIAQAHGQMFHFWLDNPANPVTEGVPWNWFGPWVVTA